MGILDNAKEVANAVHEIHNLELYERVLSLHSDIIGLVEENNSLRGEKEELTKTVALTKAMTFTEPFYYQEGDKTPYCAGCWEAKKTAIHLVMEFDNHEVTRWNCSLCKHIYRIYKTVVRSAAQGFPPSGPNSWMR
jgi:hypothetical protein